MEGGRVPVPTEDVGDRPVSGRWTRSASMERRREDVRADVLDLSGTSELTKPMLQRRLASGAGHGEADPWRYGREAPTNPLYQMGSKDTTVPAWAAWMIVPDPYWVGWPSSTGPTYITTWSMPLPSRS